MSLPTSPFPATVLFDRTPHGRFRAEFPGTPAAPVEGATLEEVLARVKLALEPTEVDEDDQPGPDFDADLDRILDEDRELLSRLAR